MPADGSKVHKVSDHLLGFGAVCWSPDGTQLLGRTPSYDAVVVLAVDGSAEPVEIPAPAAGGLASPIDWAEFPCAWQRLAP